jgi:thiamine-phosphate pyrophosphorylase
MYKNFNETYHFIDKFKEDDLLKLNPKVSLIYRNYINPIDINLIKKIRLFCKKTNRKFYLADKVKLAFNLNLDGAYIPSFNTSLKHNSYSARTNFRLIGSAHNIKEILIKNRQNVELIFLSPVYKTKNKKTFLGIYRFINLKNLTNKKIIALGGINNSNFKKLKFTNCYGIASISSIKSYYNGKSN